jgi:8-oxo-dGTP diphosphatase
MASSGCGPLVFGSAPSGVLCRKRPAAYAVIPGADGRIAVVRGNNGAWWLPGGGTEPGEAPEETVVREVLEELGRAIRLVGKIGEAVQYFYAPDDGCWYEMTAVFFRAEFEGEPLGRGEDELCWLDVGRAVEGFFHACHAWAGSC